MYNLYLNRGGNSSVLGYLIGTDSIQVRFNDGSEYLYNYSLTSKLMVDTMIYLAKSGKGLNSFISKKVNKDQFAKLG
jgi:hypothetical protein